MLIQTARDALSIWLNQLIPSLLPFMILSNYLILQGSILNYVSPRIYCLFIGHVSGYPMGARVTAAYLKGKKLTMQQAEHIMVGCNLPSPAFLLAYVLSETLHAQCYLPSLLLIFYGANLTLYFIWGSKGTEKREKYSGATDKKKKMDCMQALDKAIIDGFDTMIRILGYLLLCSLLQNIVLSLFPSAGTTLRLLISTIEMTNGIQLIANADLANTHQIALALACTAFGGLCVMTQIKGMLLGTFLSVKSYLISRIIHAGLVFLLCELFFVLIHIHII